MPELPEVETISRALREGGYRGSAEYQAGPLLGRTVIQAHVLWDRTITEPSPTVFRDRIKGQRFEAIGRRGKYLVFQLSEDTLLIHLRMSGDLIVEPTKEPYALHHRVVLDLDQDERLAFNDTRKFGRIWLLSDPETVLSVLGPEPLSSEFTPKLFFQQLQRHRRKLKPLLLDQSFLAGLGNIYTDEALFKAGLHPQTISNVLTFDQAERLWGAIRAVLQKGIQRHGASIDWVYRGGDFQNEFQVYRRTGQACNACGTPIARITVGQRGTHYCPRCQPVNVD